MAGNEGFWKAHISVLHLCDNLQVPLGGLGQAALLCIVGVDACPILRPSVTALSILHTGINVPPEHLQKILI